MYDDIGMPGGANFTVGLDGSSHYADMNKGITPVFYFEPIKNPSKTAEEGRPIFDQVECVKLFVAGDQLNQITSPVDERIRERFPVQYAAWRDKKEAMHISGTPIRQWPLLQPNQIAEFEALKIFSVEALAQVPDVSLMKSQGLREWRDKAKVWLETNKDANVAVKYAEENARLRDDMEVLKKQLVELSEQVVSLSIKKARIA